MLRIGIDGGGTATRAVVIDSNLQVIGNGEAGSSNHYSVGLERALENIARAAGAALLAANVPNSQIDCWGIGLAGACTATEQEMLRERLLPLAGDKTIIIDEDAAAAQAGAFGGAPGAVCIAGTGANCFGINEEGERARADGLGPLLGDRGSGYWIGEAALRALCRAHDHSGPATNLFDAVLLELQVASIDELVQSVYQPDFGKDRIAALFPAVLRCASEGDAVASELLNRAGQELAASTRAVLETLGIVHVAVSGGVLNRDTPVRAAFEEALRQSLPNARVQEPLYSAAMGAALMVKC
jgi:glucosamine kinase